MSFSNKDVQEALHKNFACVVENTAGDEVAGSSFAHSPKDPPPSCIRGNGEHNLQMLFLTPKGELLHGVAGFVEPTDLLDEIAFGAEVARLVAKQNTADRADVVRYRHEKALEALAKEPIKGAFARFEIDRRTDDHRFFIAHPLLPIANFRPEMMVGNAKTFFGSSQGTPPKKKIGATDGRDDTKKAGVTDPAKSGSSGGRDATKPVPPGRTTPSKTSPKKREWV